MKCVELTPTRGLWWKFAILLGPAAARCAQSKDANVCDVQFRSLHPQWNNGAEAGERNESCAVNHSLPHRSRGETHAEIHQHNTPLSQIHLHLPECSLQHRISTRWRAFSDKLNDTFPLFPRTLTFHDFLSEPLWALAYLLPQTCTYRGTKAGNVGRRRCKMKGWSHQNTSLLSTAATFLLQTSPVCQWREANFSCLN